MTTRQPMVRTTSTVLAAGGADSRRPKEVPMPRLATVAEPTLEQPNVLSDPNLGPAAHDSSATRTAPTPTVDTPLTGGSASADPLLSLAAEVRDDLQRVRIANENRLRQLTRSEADSDGAERGFGLDETHPDVARLAALVGMLTQAEHQATLNLNRRLRAHPLGAWLKAQKGIGNGTLPARLLGLIGDPAVNMQTGEPRTLSQLRSYCGHGDATRRIRKGMTQTELFACGNPAAKMILHLIAESCIKAGGPWREVYDKRRFVTEERLHTAPCSRCGPSGHPAQPGSPWSKAHQHADALRVLGKEILRGLWREAVRLHAEAGDLT